MSTRLDPKSVFVGALLSAILLGAIGAASGRLTGHEILPVRFRVVDVQEPKVEWQHGGQLRLLRLKPWYGKISRDSEQWRLKNETQDLTLVTILQEEGYQIRKDDILGFILGQHLRSGSTPSERTESPFSDVFITTDADFASGTNLCVVLETPATRGGEYDHAVAQHAAAAIQAAGQAPQEFQRVIFFLRRAPESKSGNVAAFTLTQVQDIAKLFEAGKEFNSRQSWVSRTLPAKQ